MNTPPPIIGQKTAAPPVPGKRKSPAPPIPPEMSPRLGTRVVLVRVGMFLVLAGSVALVWWSVSKRLMPASRELKEKAIAMAALANEVQQLELHWNAAEVERTEERFKQAQSLLLAGEAGFVDWQKQVERQADALALQPVTQAGAPQPPAITNFNLSRRPLTLDVHPVEIIRTTNTPYRRLLSFTRLLEQAAEKRIDFVDLSISGNSNSVQQAKLVFEAWAQEQVAQ